MDFIKEEREDMGYPEPYRVKNEDTEEQIGLMEAKVESQELNEVEEKHWYQDPHSFTKMKKSFSCSQTENNSSQQTTQRTEATHSFTCPQCGKRFTRRTTLKEHIRIHIGENPIICLQCGKSFSRKENLNRHMRIHSGEKPYTCPQCGKSFLRKENLNSHMRVHTGERPFTCNLCEQRFKYVNNHECHLHFQHTGGAKSLNCDQCDKSFIFESDLKIHKNPHLCSFCGESFSCPHHFKEHQKIHSMKAHVCLECGDAFAGAGNLKMHQRVHIKEKPNNCS
ncbi:gastrula zinc finger protein XlCGF8.2DB-like isoform X3 [Myxocyprinus asiaticus]|uniref:gastrula zinc finger protein XlCGF8.2DB-like isoform X3 n=1 Tax=Myxocyprinus asiaticus TaxID=70543 RepID=UPI00222279E2|nr:gastrula zinc finger protein XlCGF8.2DB-like isoform X3 [Myxocyprinus asiaticus]XP_051557336.1 gastrula zinc finger protein XlCGF8.2DB-like isoform X3 [Myxocyprinus asiaticus]